MTWKLYAFTSGGAVIFAAVAAIVAPTPRTQSAPVATPQAIDSSGAVVDLGAQAERLRAKLAEVSTYRQPSRDAFRFGAASRRVVESAPPAVTELPPAVITPSRPPYALAGMATTMVDGVAQRTAILSSLQGVSLVKEGDLLDAGYRVTSIADDAVTLESTSDGSTSTLRLPSN
ncbi:MAG TPA: hypothetical protein VFS23_34345 [Vicinamibacterales bacterium]|nr:hypothetical protein [Vicinamibacterales bacterium]